MSPGKAYASLLLIVLGIAGLDGVVLTSSRSLSRIARKQVDALFGDRLEYSTLTCTVSGDLELTGVGVFLTKARHKILSVDRLHVEFGYAKGSIVARQVTLDGPRFFISDRLLETIAAEKAAAAPEGGGVPEPPKEKMALPKVRCRGGAIEIAHSGLLAWDAPQILEIGEISMVPVQDSQVFVGGRLTGKRFGTFHVSGEVDIATGCHDLAVVTTGATLRPDLRAILSPTAQPIWDRFKPEGKADLEMHFAQPPGGEFSFRVTVRPVDMAIEYQFFPYRVEKVRGEIDFFGDHFVVKHARGELDGFKVQFDGRGDGYDRDSGLAFRIEVQSMPIDEKLRQALTPQARKTFDRFSPRGKVDVRGLIQRENGPDKPLHNPLDVTFRDASFRFEGFPYEIERTNGEIRIDSTEVRVKFLTGHHGTATLRFAGTVGTGEGDPAMDLFIRARNVPLDVELKQALPAKMKSLWEDFSPSGKADIDWRVEKAAGAKEQHTGTVTAKGGRVVYREVPLPVTDVTGRILIDPEQVRFEHLHGRLENGSVDINGSWKQAEGGYDLNLLIDHKGAEIDERFKKAMPKAVSTLLTSLKVTAKADYSFTLDMQERGGEMDTKYAILLDLREGLLDLPIRISDIDGQVRLTGGVANGVQHGYGSLALNTARFKGKQVTELVSRCLIKGSRVNFTSIRGRAYQGNVEGSFWIDGETTEIGGEFTADRVELSKYLQDSEKGSDRTMNGKINLIVNNIAGFGNDPDSLTATGTMTIFDAQLQQVPGLVSMLSGDERFTAARADFRIAKRRFIVDGSNTLAFETNQSGVYATGWMDFDLKYSFKARSTTAPFFGIFFLKPFALLFDLAKAPFKVRVRGQLGSDEIETEVDPEKIKQED